MSSDNDIVLTHNLFALSISGGFEDDDYLLSPERNVHEKLL